MESGKGTSKWGSFLACTVYVVLLRWLSGKEPSCSAGNEGSIPGSGKSPGEGNGNPLQCSCLENPTDRGAWRAAVRRVAKSQTQLQGLGAHARRAAGVCNGPGSLPHMLPTQQLALHPHTAFLPLVSSPSRLPSPLLLTSVSTENAFEEYTR